MWLARELACQSVRIPQALNDPRTERKTMNDLEIKARFDAIDRTIKESMEKDVELFATYNRCFEKSTTRMDELMRRIVRNEAWTTMLYGVVKELCQKETGRTADEIREEFRRRWKDALHRILIREEKANPYLAGLLDDRSFEEI
jgi:uncharacterized protein YaaW (UPF0174 family)